MSIEDEYRKQSCSVCKRQIRYNDYAAVLSEEPMLLIHLECLKAVKIEHARPKKPKKYAMDDSKTWEERYKDLEAHHTRETTYLLAKIEEIKNERELLIGENLRLDDELTQLRWETEDK